MAQARSGIMSITGTPGGEPVKVGVPVCDLVCGLYLALAVTAALRERDRTGRGQSIDVSLFEAGVSLAVWEAGKYFATGEVGGPLGSAHQSQAPYQAFRTADGWITIGANTPNTWAGLCRTLDMAAELADPGYGDASRRHARRGELLDVIESRTRNRSTAELLAALNDAGVPCAPINDYGQVFTDEHLDHRAVLLGRPAPDARARSGSSAPRCAFPHAGRPRPRRPAAGCRHACGARPVRRPGRGRRRGQPAGGAVMSDLEVSQDGAVLTVLFNRPEARNAMTFAMYEGLAEACDRADEDEGVRVLVLRGAGGAPSWPAPTSPSSSSSPAARTASRTRRGSSGWSTGWRTSRCRRSPPSRARAWAAGWRWPRPATCGWRRLARFGVPIARTLGNCLSMNSYSLLVHHLGPGRTLDMLLRARLLSADDAHAAGFVGEVVPAASSTRR